MIRKAIAPLLALLAFTNPRGVKFYLDSESIVAVASGYGYCTPETLTRIAVGDGGYCVKEGIEEVVQAVRDAAKTTEEDDTAEEAKPDPCATPGRYEAMAKGVDCSGK